MCVEKGFVEKSIRATWRENTCENSEKKNKILRLKSKSKGNNVKNSEEKDTFSEEKSQI